MKKFCIIIKIRILNLIEISFRFFFNLNYQNYSRIINFKFHNAYSLEKYKPISRETRDTIYTDRTRSEPRSNEMNLIKSRIPRQIYRSIDRSAKLSNSIYR